MSRSAVFGASSVVALLSWSWLAFPEICLAQPAEAAVPQAASPRAATDRRSLDIVELSLEDLLDVKITTASRVLERATEAPATVYVISQDDIRMRGYSTLIDVLRDLPGMEVVEQYYSEQGTLVPVRGVVGNNKIVLLINGMRVNPPGGEELMIRNDTSVRFAEQIEIIYGPGSTLYGQDAISAVINIKTKRPGGATVEALAAYGLHDTREAYGSFATRLRDNTSAPLALTGYVAARSADLANFRKEFPDWWLRYQTALEGMGRATDPVRVDRGLNVFARLESNTASVQAWFRDSRRSSAEGSGEGGPMPVLYFIDEARWRDRALVVEGQHALRLSSKLTLTSLLTFNRYEVMPESRYVFPIAGTLFLDDFKYAVGVGAQVEEKLDVDVSDTTRLMFGFTAANCDIIPKATVPGGADPDQDIIEQAGKLTYYQQVDGVLVRTDLNRTTDYHYQQFGFYAEGSHRFNDLFRVIAGVRVDLSTRYDDVPVSPRAAAVFTGLGGRLTLKYVFQRAYVAPAPYFSYNIFDNGVRISKGNPDLRPEKALSNEVQVAWQDRQLLVTASAYYNHQSDLLITAQSELPDTEIGEVFVNADGTGRRTLTKSINLGTSNAYGFDVSSRYKSDRFSSWASYSYVDFQRKTGGIESGLGQISRHNVRAGLTLSVLRNLHVTPSLVFRSMPENLTATYDGLGVSLDNPYEVNLNLLYAPTRYLDVFATIRNLTDHHYALRGVSGPALQEPLSGWLGLRFAY